MDPVLVPLTLSDAALLRRLVQSWLVEHGREGVMAAGEVKLDGLHGLTNLARLCAQQPGGPADWPGVIDAHFATLLPALQNRVDADALSPADFTSRVMLRLWPDDMLGLNANTMAGWANVAPGLVQTLVLDEPNTVRSVAVSQAARVGEQILLRAARDNLAQAHYERHIADWHGIRVDVLRSDSSYMASQLLVLDDILGRMYPYEVAPSGVLVAVPDRSMMLLHVVASGTGTRVVSAMRRYARERHGHAPWPLSPHVYWWYDGELSVADTPVSDDSDSANDPGYDAFKDSITKTEPTPRAAPANPAAGETERPVISLHQFPAAAREVLAIALRVSADHIANGMKTESAFTPFVLMGDRSTFNLVLIQHAEMLPAGLDPFVYMHKFMTSPNQFAIMAVTARPASTEHADTGHYLAIVQIEHVAGVSTRIAVPYRLTATGNPRFGRPFPYRRIPADWPTWNQGLAPTA
jgi:hypothetical protein